jgi:hypothetical protein
MNLKQTRETLATIAIRLTQPRLSVADRKNIANQLMDEVIPSLRRTRNPKATQKAIATRKRNTKAAKAGVSKLVKKAKKSRVFTAPKAATSRRRART